MSGLLIVVTDVGRAALVSADNTGTNAHRVLHIGLSNQAFDANRGLKALPGQFKLIDTFGGKNVSPDTIHVTLQDSSADQYTLYGFGLYLENGTLLAVYAQSTPIMEKSPAAQLLLSADIQFTTIDAATLQFPDASFLNPPATETQQGVIEIATQDETNAGQDDSRAITPKKAATRYASLTGANFTGPISVRADTQFRAIGGDYGALLRNDGTNVYLLSTKKGDASGQWNDFRPLTWNLDTGYVTVDAGGRGVTLGGTLNVGSNIQAGGDVAGANVNVGKDIAIGGYARWRSDQALAWIATLAEWSYFRSNGHMSIGSEAQSGSLQFVAGNQVHAQLLPGGRLLLHTTTDDGATTLQVGGPIKGVGSRGALCASNGGGTGQASILLARDGAPKDARWWEALQADDGSYMLRIVNDAYSDARLALAVTRRPAPGSGSAAPLFDLDKMSLMPSGGVVVVGDQADASGDRLQVRGAGRFDGDVSIQNGDTEMHLRLGPIAGYWYGSKTDWGFWSQNSGALQYIIADRTLRVDGHVVFHEGNLAPLDRNLGGTVSADLTIEGHFHARGTASFEAGIQITGTDAGGAHVRAIGGNYGAFLRNDGSTAYLLSTKKGDAGGTFNDYRPLAWNLDTGYVTIDANRHGAGVGGDLSIGGAARIGPAMDEAHIYLGPRADGYLYASRESFGWWYGAAGSLQYIFADHSLQIDGHRVWHDGNLTPLDRNVGGQIDGNVSFAPGARVVLAEGSVQAPSLTFANDGASDTGLFHIADGMFGVACNSISAVTFSPSRTDFNTPITTLTPSDNDRSTTVPTTAWVTSAIARDSIGQIVFEVRTSARPGYLIANGAELHRADYPALWAYAQASGALVSQADWVNGLWGCFSMGDGATTFRIPQINGEFIRCWGAGRSDLDAGRAIGSIQRDQNKAHAHDASSGIAGDHTHAAWSDQMGQHSHGVNDPGHTHSINGDISSSKAYFNAVAAEHGISNYTPFTSEPAKTGVALAEAGNHGHSIAVAAVGGHSHTVMVSPDGGNEARPQNIALLAVIRAY